MRQPTDSMELTKRRITRWGLTSVSAVILGLRVARHAADFSFTTALAISEMIHKPLRAGAQATSNIPIAGPITSSTIDASERITQMGISLASFFTHATLRLSEASLQPPMHTLSTHAMIDMELDQHDDLLAHTTTLVALGIVDLAEQFGQHIPRDRLTLLALGHAMVTYGHLQLALRSPFPPSNALWADKSKCQHMVYTTLPRLIRYSIASYGSSFCRTIGMRSVRLYPDPTMLILDLCNLDADSVVDACWNSQTLLPAYGIFIDPKLNAVVVVFRGSFNFHDCLTDLCCRETSEGAHEGFMRSARTFDARVRAKLLLALHAMPEHYTLILTGQSMGAAVATTLGLLWEDEEFWRARKGHVYAFNAPCTLSLDRAHAMRDSVTSIVGGPDLVSRLSYGSVVNLLAALRKLASPVENGQMRYQTLTAQLAAFKNGEIERGVLEKVHAELRSTMREEVLYPGGRVLMMVATKECMEWTPPKHPNSPSAPFYSLGGALVLELRGTVLDLGEIVIGQGMFADHSPMKTLNVICNE
eukprot:GEMP01001684.1.p1 GENE.GEMP01001684.1~~GEMP01001684.1.p1  ORF type:complete len:531 (+),score=120.07 GEMP01001684.1:267-1859(+)